jgi:hypothetical protein
LVESGTAEAIPLEYDESFIIR